MIQNVIAYIGEDGIGQASEDVAISPRGVYSLPSAFGIKPSPGTALPYTTVGDDHYWVSDMASPYYNQLVSEKTTTNFDKECGEHLIEGGDAYHYAIVIG